MNSKSENSQIENQDLAQLAGKFADAITDLESGKKMDEKEKDELTQMLLEEEMQNIDNRIIEAQRDKLLGLLLFVEPEIPNINEAVGIYENCVRGILQIALYGATKKEMIDSYLKGKIQGEPDEIFLLGGPEIFFHKGEHLSDNERSRKRLSSTIDSLLKAGVIHDTHGFLYSDDGMRGILVTPPYIKRLEHAESEYWQKHKMQ